MSKDNSRNASSASWELLMMKKRYYVDPIKIFGHITITFAVTKLETKLYFVCGIYWIFLSIQNRMVQM